MSLAAAREALNPMIHSPVRLTLMCALASVESADYQTLKEELDLSYALLSKHASLLEGAGYLSARKTFRGKTPQTHYALTKAGRTALDTHLAALDEIVQGL